MGRTADSTCVARGFVSVKTVLISSHIFCIPINSRVVWSPALGGKKLSCLPPVPALICSVGNTAFLCCGPNVFGGGSSPVSSNLGSLLMRLAWAGFTSWESLLYSSWKISSASLLNSSSLAISDVTLSCLSLLSASIASLLLALSCSLNPILNPYPSKIKTFLCIGPHLLCILIVQSSQMVLRDSNWFCFSIQTVLESIRR